MHLYQGSGCVYVHVSVPSAQLLPSIPSMHQHSAAAYQAHYFCLPGNGADLLAPHTQSDSVFT